jgi:hypothetical protein
MMKLNKGDRIAFYKAGQPRKIGTVDMTGMPYYINVTEDKTKEIHRVHPKQCRKLRRQPFHYCHDVTLYVPCFQDNTNPEYPTFYYSTKDATVDEQMCLAEEPDYVLVLQGKFDAMTKPVKG